MGTAELGSLPTASPSPGGQLKSRSAIVLTVVCAAQLVLAVDITVVLVANVQIKEALHFSDSGLTWIVTAYALTYGGFLLLFGRLSDVVGHRKLFVLGMLAFGVSSAFAAASFNPLQLVLSRAAQGISAACISPAALALLGDHFPEGPKRTRAFGYWAASGSLGGVLGYTAGGMLVGYLGWRWAFIVNLPIAVVSVWAAQRFLLHHDRSGARADRLPVAGSVGITIGASALIYELSEAHRFGWVSLPSGILLAITVVALTLFTVHEVRSKAPLVPLSVLGRREAVANVSAALQAAAISSAVFLGSLLLQEVLGYSPQQVGFAALPIPVGVAIGAFVVGRVLRRVHRLRLVIVVGAVIMTAGLFWVGWGSSNLSYVGVLLPSWFLLGFGLAVSQVPMVNLATSNATTQQRGSVAGVYNMSQQLGTALGLAVMAAVAANRGSATSLHGLQSALLWTAVLGLALVVQAALTLPPRIRTTPAVQGFQDPTGIAEIHP